MFRRDFLASLSCSLLPLSVPVRSAAQAPATGCWLEVAAPLLLENPARGWQSELVLTADTFNGVRGYEDGKQGTEYEVCLYDAQGKPIDDKAVTKRLTAPAMHTTVLDGRVWWDRKEPLAGGVKVRLRPQAGAIKHASDLFSSAFLRWRTATSFDNVHANPDPPQWQNTESYFYSMPFPSLVDYDCLFSLFNPNAARSAGVLEFFDASGKRVIAQPYELSPHASLFFDLNARRTLAAPWEEAKSVGASLSSGVLAVTNQAGTAKGFGYLMMRSKGRERFSIEHPIHQGFYKPATAAPPFDERQQFKAHNVLYSPLLFKNRKLGGLTFSSRFYLGTGMPPEDTQWFYPFAVDEQGNAAWSSQSCPKLMQTLPTYAERGLLKLKVNQSCQLDFNQLSLPNDFAGGLGVAVAPDTSHTLIKVEVRVQEWGAFAFTHFRPGFRAARRYQQSAPRGTWATDYIASGARFARQSGKLLHDELLAVINIDDQEVTARPVLELFNAQGLFKRISLPPVAPLACRHYLLSDLLTGELATETLSLRLLDERATLLMSVIHLDHVRRDLALDHGSDRFSTFHDFGCA